MKVLQVVMDNRIGGVQVRVLAVHKELKKYHIETIIITPKEKGDFAQRAKEDFKVYQICLNRPRNIKSFTSILSNFKWFFTFIVSVLEIIKIIRKENIDIVHLNGLLNLQAAFAALFTKKKIVWHLIGSVYPSIIVLLFMPLVKLLSDRIILVANKMQNYYFKGKIEDRIKNRISIIYEPVDTVKFNQLNINQLYKDKLKAEFNIKSNEKLIGCVGNINPAKGYEYFIQSSALIKKKINDIKFIIIGAELDTQKSYYQQLKTLISSLKMDDDYIFTGERVDIPQILSLFDIFVMSSILEGTPIAILEAMAMELPVIATDVGGIAEQVIDRETGILVRSRDPIGLAVAIEYLLNNQEKAKEMGIKGKEHVRARFSLNACNMRHLEIYNTLYNY